MIIKNGIVYDPASHSLVKRDVSVVQGKITSNINDVKDDQIIEADGCYVLPGMIDSHAHVNRTRGGFGTHADQLCIPNGVMTLIDAGSLGVNGIECFINDEIPLYQTNIKILLHIAADGQSLTTPEKLHDDNIPAEKIIAVYQRYHSFIKGLKIRYEENSILGYGLKPLETCIGISEKLGSNGYSCPITVHLGDMGKEVSLSQLLSALRPGDVVAHAFQRNGETILDADGCLKDCVKEAREKGIKFDLAHGRMCFTFYNLKRAALEGFWPDLLGTDIHGGNAYKMPAFSIMNTMTMMYALGMPLIDMFRALTCTPALIWGFQEGINGFRDQDEANISIIYKEPKVLEITDVNGDTIQADTIFRTKAVIKQGEILYCLNS